MLPLTEGFRYHSQTKDDPMYWRQYPGGTLHIIARPWVSPEDLLNTLDSPPDGFDHQPIPVVKEALIKSWNEIGRFISSGGGVTSFGEIIPMLSFSADQKQRLDKIGYFHSEKAKAEEILGLINAPINSTPQTNIAFMAPATGRLYTIQTSGGARFLIKTGEEYLSLHFVLQYLKKTVENIFKEDAVPQVLGGLSAVYIKFFSESTILKK